MFIRKRDFLELEEKVKELEEKVSKLQNFKDSLVFCAKCGCAVKRADAYKAPPTVKKDRSAFLSLSQRFFGLIPNKSISTVTIIVRSTPRTELNNFYLKLQLILVSSMGCCLF